MSGPSLEVIAYREVWTPPQAALILGRSHNFWRRALIEGRVAGTIEGTARRPVYRIDAGSARALNGSLGRRVEVRVDEEAREDFATRFRAGNAAFRAGRKVSHG